MAIDDGARLAAAPRGHSDIAVGNVIGSDVFDVLSTIVGASGVAGPLDVPIREARVDLGGLLVTTVARRRLPPRGTKDSRREGTVLLTLCPHPRSGRDRPARR